MVAITAAWVTQPVFGGLITTNEIVITENSSTSLIVIYNGSTSGVTVNFLGHTPVGDGWKVTFPSTVSFTSVDNTGVIALWIDPLAFLLELNLSCAARGKKDRRLRLRVYHFRRMKRTQNSSPRMH